jgi:hypothetical protein
MITEAQYRRMALACGGAIEASHMGHPDFRAFGRIFATIQTAERGAIMLTPEQQAEFLRVAPRAFVPESGAWGLQGATRIIFAEVDEEKAGEALTLAWQNRAVAAVKRAAKPRRTDAAVKRAAKPRRTDAAVKQAAKPRRTDAVKQAAKPRRTGATVKGGPTPPASRRIAPRTTARAKKGGTSRTQTAANRTTKPGSGRKGVATRAGKKK